MLLRLTGVLILVALFMAVVVLFLGLRREPEKVRELAGR
jgi:hypothetical protein